MALTAQQVCEDLLSKPATNFEGANLVAGGEIPVYEIVDEIPGVRWRIIFVSQLLAGTKPSWKRFDLVRKADRPEGNVTWPIFIHFRDQEDADRIVGRNLQKLLVEAIPKVLADDTIHMVDLRRDMPNVIAILGA